MPTESHDPSEFMIPESDQNGRSVRIVVQVPPLLNKAMNDIISSQKFPFEITDDLIRWSLHQGVKDLAAMKGCTGIIPFLEIGRIITQMNMDLKRFEEFFAALDRIVLELIASGYQQARARNLVSAMRELILSMPSGSDRSWFLRELRLRWGHLLTSPAKQTAHRETEGCRG